MACRVGDIARVMERWAPLDTCEPGDNAGLLTGAAEQLASHVLIALDVDEALLKYARAIGADMIITHHPHIYKPIVAVTDSTRAGKLTLTATAAGIALYAAHTNLDRAAGGVNDALCAAVGFENAVPTEPGGIARVARLPETLPLDTFAETMRLALGAPGVRVTGDGSQPVRTVCVVSGAGRHYFETAAACGADCLLTGEIGYHDAFEALNLGLGVLEAGHWYTERPVLPRIEKHLQSQFQLLQYTIRTTVYEPSGCPFHTVG